MTQGRFRTLLAVLFGLICCFDCVPPVHPAAAGDKGLYALIGKQDAVLVTDSNGKILFEKNADKTLIPASTLKILTALTALNALGTDFRFTTEFYADKNNDLRIKGYGDPLLLSEVMPDIAVEIRRRLPRIRRIIPDDTYFAPELRIPGAARRSVEPYDSPVGALCVNFNTVCFKTNPATGKYVSNEPQTPLLPFVLPRIRQSGIAEGRILLTGKKNEASLYAGHLFQYFFQKAGIETGDVMPMQPDSKPPEHLIYRYRSTFDMNSIIAKLLYYSNNFIANQLMIAAGAKTYGPPGTLEKGLRVMKATATEKLGIQNIMIAEGSGISRRNRLSARMMDKMLAAFAPHRALMRQEKGHFYKTGHLSGIRTRAGYIETGDGRLVRFVVLLNTNGKSTLPVMKAIQRAVSKS